MSNKSNRKNRLKVFSNNAYAVKTVFGISKSRVIHTAFFAIIGYVEWIFMSIYFLRHIVQMLEDNKSFEAIAGYIGICFLVFGSLCIYSDYRSSVIIPFTDIKIYRELYKKLYAKARNVELRCFEDAEFYNKYTLALDGAAQKMTISVEIFVQIIFGVIAAAVAFASMYLIDPYAILFVISPIIGNFVFGGLMNKIWNGIYVDNAPHNRKAEYVNRVMHLAEFA